MHGIQTNTIDWSIGTVATLTKMWADGHSCTEIAQRIPNATRSAIIGKVHRLKLPVPDYKKSAKARSHVRVAKRSPAPVAPDPAPARLRNGYDPALRRNPSHNILAAIAIAGTESGLPERLKGEKPDGTGVKLIDLDSTTCRWPRGNPGDADFEFCGGYALDGKPYCRLHCALAYGAPQSRSRAPQKMGV